VGGSPASHLDPLARQGEQTLARQAPDLRVRALEQLAQQWESLRGRKSSQRSGDGHLQMPLSQAEDSRKQGEELRLPAVEHGRQEGLLLRARQRGQFVAPDKQLALIGQRGVQSPLLLVRGCRTIP